MAVSSDLAATFNARKAGRNSPANGNLNAVHRLGHLDQHSS